MGDFTEEMRSRLPEGMALPEAMAALFGWIEARGWLHPSGLVEGDRFGTLQPLDGERGAIVLFRIMGPAEARDFVKAWSGDAESANRLVPIARTGGDGSQAAFWLDDDGRQHVVHLGSEGDSLCVLGQTPVDFLRLLAIGYGELGTGLSFPHRPPDDTHTALNPDFVEWLTATYGVTIPQTAYEIVGQPRDAFEGHCEDPFWLWLHAQWEKRDGAVRPEP